MTRLSYEGATWLNSALWSLQWEVLFSALLPVLILILVRFRYGTLLRALALPALVVLGTRTSHASLVYLPIFGFGVLMAQQLAWLDSLGARYNSMRKPAQICIAFCGGLLLGGTLDDRPPVHLIPLESGCSIGHAGRCMRCRVVLCDHRCRQTLWNATPDFVAGEAVLQPVSCS